jgi:hypothetical protein
LDLAHHALSFGLLRGDRGVGGRNAGRNERCGEGDDEDWGLSFQNLDDVSRRSPDTTRRAPFVTRSGR